MHWTNQSTDSYISAMKIDFISQLEAYMYQNNISKKELAERLEDSVNINKVFRSSKELTLELMVKISRALKIKTGIVLYDDNDPDNNQGPVIPMIFIECWEQMNKPTNGFELFDSINKANNNGKNITN